MIYNMSQMLEKIILLSIFLKLASAIPGIVETLAGGGPPHKGKVGQCIDKDAVKDGIGDEARFNYPWGIAFDHFQNTVYVADCGCTNSEHPTDRIRKIDLATQEVRTVAGSTQGFADGFGPYAHFKHIKGLTIDPDLEMLYIADSGNHRIRLMYLANNKVITIAGLPSPGFVDQSTISSQFNNPQSLAVYRSPNGERLLYVADTDNHAIRVIHLQSDETGYVKTIAGGTKGFKDGTKLSARFYYPSDIVVDGIGQYMYVTDHFNHAIRRIELESGMVTTLAGNGFVSETGLDNRPKSVTFHYPDGLVYDPDYRMLYVCEFNNHDVLAITMEGLVKTLAGEKKGRKDGVGRVARFNHPSGLTFDRKTRTLYMADQYNHLVRSISSFGSDKKYDPDVMKRKRLKKLKDANKDDSPFMNLYVYGIIVAVIFFLLLIAKPCFRLCFKLNNNDYAYTQIAIRQTTL